MQLGVSKSMKRLVSVLLCVCLMCSALGVFTTVSAAKAGEFVLQKLDFRISVSVTLQNNGEVFASELATFDPIDLTKYDYATDPARVVLQLDTYVSGDEAFVACAEKGFGGGQVEISSSGTWDEEELSFGTNAIGFEGGKWIRVQIPLSTLTDKYGAEFRPEHFNYVRIYFADVTPLSYRGSSGMIKIINPCIVDTAVPEEERPDTQVGDGSFVPEAPEFRKVQFAPGYDDSVAVFAGYNLKEYLQEHPSVTITDRDGNLDYSAVVNSLLSGLQQAGGGTLFIPAGEWEFRNEIIIPPGTSICGEWTNPDKNPEIRGTILKVYCGKGASGGTPFIDMEHHTKVQNLSIWYPEQTVETIAEYPPSIKTDQYTFVQNVTLVNSYIGIVSTESVCCPNAWNIYGTPLSVGVDFDLVVDIARIEELHFSADYWELSGLPGAPVSALAHQLLKDHLYTYGVGLALRRIDWSYATYSDIRGYNIALLFAESADGRHYPNGQCVAFNITNCKYAVFVYGVNYCTEAVSEFNIKNCEYGFYLVDRASSTAEGALNVYNSTIAATEQAIYQDSMVQLNVTNCTVKSGDVITSNGNNTFINNRLHNAAPQILLDYGTVAGVLVGNVNASGKPIVYENPGRCTFGYDEHAADIDPYEPMTREEAAGPLKGPRSADYVIPTDLDTTGTADVTEALQGYLTALGENGGGFLFLRPGKYRIDGTLTVPTGVELRGSGDFATIPMAANTVLQVYTKVENDKTAEDSAATVTLEEESGLRGIIFNYPEQNSTYRVIDTVYDPVEQKDVDYYAFDFIPYPYTVRGTGADVYLVNVTVRNGWNGVDLATYRCDNHYVDYLAGHFFHRGIVVGNGSKGGYIRNYQFNYNSIYAPYVVTWFGFGGVPNFDLQKAFHQPMQAQFNNHAISLQLGHVEEQLVYNCFNYSSYIGVHLIEENGHAADVRIFGHGVDYATQAIKIEAAEHVTFTNLQVTSFNQCGSDANTERWAVDQSVTPLYGIWLTETFKGEVNVYNFSEWGGSPTAAVRVDSGVLNLYNTQFNNRTVPTFDLNGTGTVHALGINFVTTSGLNYITVTDPPIAQGQVQNLHITAGFWQNEQTGTDKVGTFRFMYPFKLRYAVPHNVIFPENGTVTAVESFDNYTFNETAAYQADNPSCVSIRRGAVRIRVNDSQFSAALYSAEGETGYPFELTDGVYRMEWRVNIESMRGSEDSAVFLQLINTAGRSAQILTIGKDGTLALADGTKVCNVTYGTYYRLALDVDTVKETVRVVLMDDEANVISASTAVALPQMMRGDNTVGGFRFGTMATPYEAAGTETDMYIDYFYLLHSEESTFPVENTGDVDGNGTIDSTDARLILQYAVGKIHTLQVQNAADVDGSGKIDSTDARLVLQYAVGKIQEFRKM